MAASQKERTNRMTLWSPRLITHTFESPHDKTNKMACGPSEDSDQLGIRPVWSESISLVLSWGGSFCELWTRSRRSGYMAFSAESERTKCMWANQCLDNMFSRPTLPRDLAELKLSKLTWNSRGDSSYPSNSKTTRFATLITSFWPLTWARVDRAFSPGSCWPQTLELILLTRITVERQPMKVVLLKNPWVTLLMFCALKDTL